MDIGTLVCIVYHANITIALPDNLVFQFSRFDLWKEVKLVVTSAHDLASPNAGHHIRRKNSHQY